MEDRRRLLQKIRDDRSDKIDRMISRMVTGKPWIDPEAVRVPVPQCRKKEQEDV